MVIFILLAAVTAESKVTVIPTGQSQEDFLKAYKYAMYTAYVDYRFTNSTMDSVLFPKFGEFSVYWAKTGSNRGSFIIPDIKSSGYASVTSNETDSYDWKSAEHYSLQFKIASNRIAIFRSKIKKNNNTVSWEAIYFKTLFDTYLFDNTYCYVDEDDILKGISGSTHLLIIPAFTLNGMDNTYYIDKIFTDNPGLKEKINDFLARGGTIYTEGNAAYLAYKLGYLQNCAANFNNMAEGDPETGMMEVNFNQSDNPIAFTENAVDGKLYVSAVPYLNPVGAEIIATSKTDNIPVAFVLKGPAAGGGRIVCNTGLPTAGGINNIKQGSRQLQWTLNAIFYAFAENIDVTRSVYNELPDSITDGKNAVAYDAADQFEVRIKLRNLSSETVSDITLQEVIRDYFKFIEVKTAGVDFDITGQRLVLKDITLAPFEEKEIVYILSTPDREDKIHEDVDKYISFQTYIYSSVNYTSYNDNDGLHLFYKYRNYVDVMFSAQLAADTDLNWKNFLGLYYQPFKVFMIMENKERTPAEGTVYTQYIPKDVPFYQSDKSIDIPILKTPGGKYIDVLRGSDDQNNPEYDMDGDGHPDVWLDTASIYPKGYTITEEEVYWLNPWEHLRSGNHFYYEDIDHDGKRAEDTNGDGIVDIEEPGDKIRVWKVQWDIGKIAGYGYFDPYCYYEIWVDPPDLVPMAAGIGQAKGLLDKPVDGMFYPYTKNLADADLSDTTWSHWMERDKDGNVTWKQLIWQKIDNYEGFTFIDTAKTGYRLKPTDFCAGTVPQPHREFIAVLSLGGEEIDMYHPTPQNSLYSKINYKTIFNEDKVTPIRTTYTYYAPLPNPLQFEYLSNCYTITDEKNKDTLRFLPEWGKANLTFDVDASTEYTYYWIRNVGYDVDYNDPSEKIDSIDKLGDGVFGYMIYDIPKGMGGYKITLPVKEDGSYDMDKIVSVDGKPFTKWIDNPNTGNEVEIWEDPYQYHVYIPQLLIPPALDDDNNDGIDDWIDDRGDRFCSKTGFLHDAFMPGNGEEYRNYPAEPFKDDIYGMVDSGWYYGADKTYGDDFFENLGKVHFKIHATYEGLGKEGPVDISKGGWLVVEEIFGGSPWVIFSHTLSGYAKGVDYQVVSSANPSKVKFGIDTSYIKHVIRDRNEPHDFNSNFDPYHVSFGYGESTVTTYAGGKDPCSLIEPDISLSTIIDPAFSRKTVTLVPLADKDNPDLKDYPKKVTGSLMEVRIEVMNGTDDNWINTTVTPEIPAALGNTKVVMSYVAYPRPLVPAKVDPKTGEIIQGGDDLGTFRAGWRFNQPEDEVLIKMGNNLPLMQPSRRGYFIFLVSVDESLPLGVYNIDFKIDGTKKHYTGKVNGKVDYEVPSVYFSMSKRDASGNVKAYQKIVVGSGKLKDLQVHTSGYFQSLKDARWSDRVIDHTDYDGLTSKLPSYYDPDTGIDRIDLSGFGDFPTKDLNEIQILEKGVVDSYNGFDEAGDNVLLSSSSVLNYNFPPFGDKSVKASYVKAATTGPKIYPAKKILTINGEKVKGHDIFTWDNTFDDKLITAEVKVSNFGNDIAENTVLDVHPGTYFVPQTDSNDTRIYQAGDKIEVIAGTLVPGESKTVYLNFRKSDEACKYVYNKSDAIDAIDVAYRGSGGGKEDNFITYSFKDTNRLNFPASDIGLVSFRADKKKLDFNTKVKLTAEYANGLSEPDSIALQIFAVMEADSNIIGKADTVLIGEEYISGIMPLETKEFSVNYQVPENIRYIEFFAKVDSSNKLCEFCENNNRLDLILPFEGPGWVIDVSNYPNPFAYNTNLTYTLPNEMQSVWVDIYTVDGKKIQTIRNCGSSAGVHNTTWSAPNLTNGAYYYIIKGTGQDGKVKEYYGKMVKQGN